MSELARKSRVWRTKLGAAATDALIAGGAGAVVETLRIAIDARDVGFVGWFAIVALGIAGATVLSLFIQLVVGIALRVPGVAAVVDDFATDETRRVIIAWRVLLGAGALIAFGMVAFVVTSRLHVSFRFKESNVMGALVASLVTPLALAAVAAAVVIDRRLTPMISRFPGVLSGGRRWAVAVIACVGGVIAPTLLAERIVPEANVEPVLIVSAVIMCATTIRLVGAARLRALRIAAPVLAIFAVTGSLLVGRAEHARAAVVAYGAVSKGVAKVMWRLADRDHDGYAPAWIGGADCDDRDPDRSPSRRDVINNGIDENCTGHDAPASQPPVPSSAPGDGKRPNVILISLDTIRADHLASWGYKRPTSPSIDKLATQGTRFDIALTSSPSTRYALPSLLSGRFASTTSRSEPPSTLAESLKAAGYETLAVLCCQGVVARRELRGFDEVDTDPEAVRLARKGQSNADAVAGAAINHLERYARRSDPPPLFLWVHFYDAHHPYQAPERPTAFGSSDLDRYDAEIAYLDRNIGELLNALDARKLTENTVVVLTSDHGEEFGEHGIRFHARSLFNQVTRVPLIIRAPGGTARVVTQPVSIVDVMPTVLDLVGVPAPALNGRSLAGAVRGVDRGPTRPVFVELVAESWYKRNAVAIVTSEWKVIWDREANAWSLYATSDVGDRDDRADAAPEQLAAMKKLLGETLDRELAVEAPR